MATYGDSFYINTIAGALYGQAIADAAALTCKGYSQKEIDAMWKNCHDSEDFILPYPYTSRYGNYPQNDWTSTTDQSIVTMNTLIDGWPDIHIDIDDYSGKLRHWLDHGFPEMNDGCSIGADDQTSLAIRRREFLEDALLASKDLWERGPTRVPSNGTINRCVPIAFLGNLEDVIKNTIFASRMTHYDSRTDAACVLINSILWTILRIRKLQAEKGVEDFKINVEELIQKNYLLALKYIDKEWKEDFKFFVEADFEKIELSSVKKSLEMPKYVLKTMSAALYGLRATGGRRDAYFKRIITIIAIESGDSCANAGLAGALIGAIVGFNNLPKDWIQALPYQEYFKRRVLNLNRIVKMKIAEFDERQRRIDELKEAERKMLEKRLKQEALSRKSERKAQLEAEIEARAKEKLDLEQASVRARLM